MCVWDPVRTILQSFDAVLFVLARKNCFFTVIFLEFLAVGGPHKARDLGYSLVSPIVIPALTFG